MRFLGYLLCSTHRRAPRSQLLSALWPTSESETAVRSLNKAIQLLQRVLSSGNAGSSHTFVEGDKANAHGAGVSILPLRLDDDWLVLAGQECVWVDADVFEEMLQTEIDTLASPRESNWAKIASSRIRKRYKTRACSTSQQREQLLQTALALYNGEFLPEERDAEWVLLRRQTLRHTWVAAVLELTDLYTARNALVDAVKILDRLLAKDPTNEAAVQRLMIVLARSMRRTEAIRAYRRFENILRSEYQCQTLTKNTGALRGPAPGQRTANA